MEPHVPSAQTATPAPFPFDAQSLQQFLHAINDRMNELQQRMEATSTHPATAAIPSTSTIPAAAPSLHPPNSEQLPSAVMSKLLSKPSQFYGKHGQEVYDWLSEWDHMFRNIGTISDQKKIEFAVGSLHEEALRWWDAREREVELSRQRQLLATQSGLVLDITEKQKAHIIKEITTWVEFKQAFTEYFSPRGASEAARTLLHNLRQSQFPNLAAYCDRFETIARRITTAPGHDISDELITTFKAGISSGFIRLHLTTAGPASLFEAIRLAMQAEGDLRSSNMASGSRDHHIKSSSTSGANRYMRGRSNGNHYNGQYSHAAGWNSPSSYYHRPGAYPSAVSHRPIPASGDTSAPMDLSVLGEVEVSPEQSWRFTSPEVGMENDYVSRDDHDSPTLSNQVLGDDQDSDGQHYDSSASDIDNDSQLNFVGRGRRPTSGFKYSNRRQGDRRPGFGSSSVKQQFLKKNNCWNCGKPDHFLVDCPFQKGNANSSAGSSSKLESKKF